MRSILEQLSKGEITPEEAESKIRNEILEVGDFAKLDINREERTGVPEVILAQGKRVEHLKEIIVKALERDDRVILSKVESEAYEQVRRDVDLSQFSSAYHIDCGVWILKRKDYKSSEPKGTIGIITAGTSDIPVAREAEVIAEELGCRIVKAYDVGVAGLHRVLEPLGMMVTEEVDVYIVAAGREGALPTIVAGLVDAPVIGLPISTGYGIEGEGRTALFAMLQSCSPLVVVNIDAGFVAAAVASQVVSRVQGKRGSSQD